MKISEDTISILNNFSAINAALLFKEGSDIFTISEAKKLKPVIRTTVGWRISENKEGIILATDYFNDE